MISLIRLKLDQIKSTSSVHDKFNLIKNSITKTCLAFVCLLFKQKPLSDRRIGKIGQGVGGNFSSSKIRKKKKFS